MNFDNFLQTWNQALREAHLYRSGMSPKNTVNLDSMERNYEVYIPISFGNHRFDPFFVSVQFSWKWGPILSARFETTEEDFLTQIYGDHNNHEDTDPPLVRIDITFHASLPMDSYALLPLPDSWERWANAIISQIPDSLEDAFQEVSYDQSISFCGEPTVRTTCSSSGQFYLSGVDLEAWKMIILPRQWDSPDPSPEVDPFDQLVDLFRWVYNTADFWGESLKALSYFANQ